MTISALILLHYKERDEKNAPIIINALKNGTRVPENIVVFIDNPEINFEDSDITIIRSNTPFPVTARNAIPTLFDTDYVFLQDSDLCVEKRTIEYLANNAEDYPNSVIGFEGSRMGPIEFPYTKGEVIDRGDKIEPVDMLIRTWFAPTKVVGMSINLYLNNKGAIPNKYVDDILICLGNRLGYREQNYVLPIVKDAGVVEIGENGVAQCYSTTHYKIRDQVCRYLLRNSHD